MVSMDSQDKNAATMRDARVPSNAALVRRLTPCAR